MFEHPGEQLYFRLVVTAGQCLRPIGIALDH